MLWAVACHRHHHRPRASTCVPWRMCGWGTPHVVSVATCAGVRYSQSGAAATVPGDFRRCYHLSSIRGRATLQCAVHHVVAGAFPMVPMCHGAWVQPHVVVGWQNAQGSPPTSSMCIIHAGGTGVIQHISPMLRQLRIPAFLLPHGVVAMGGDTPAAATDLMSVLEAEMDAAYHHGHDDGAVQRWPCRGVLLGTPCATSACTDGNAGVRWYWQFSSCWVSWLQCWPQD